MEIKINEEINHCLSCGDEITTNFRLQREGSPLVCMFCDPEQFAVPQEIEGLITIPINEKMEIKINDKFIDASEVILQVSIINEKTNEIKLIPLNALERGFTEYKTDISLSGFKDLVNENIISKLIEE